MDTLAEEMKMVNDRDQRSCAMILSALPLPPSASRWWADTESVNVEFETEFELQRKPAGFFSRRGGSGRTRGPVIPHAPDAHERRSIRWPVCAATKPSPARSTCGWFPTTCGSAATNAVQIAELMAEEPVSSQKAA